MQKYHDKLKAITREIITFRYVKIYQVFSGSEIKLIIFGVVR